MIAFIVITGCIETPQTQAEKVGWDEAKYKEYSEFYIHLVTNTSDTPDWWGQGKKRYMGMIFEIEDKLMEIPKDKNEFERAWYLVFLNYKRGLEYLSEQDRVTANKYFWKARDIKEKIELEMRPNTP